MAMSKKFAVFALALLVSACGATYFKVTDRATGREYYTVDFTHKGDAIEFKDAKTGARTTLQNPEILEINKQTFNAGIDAAAR